MQNATRVLIADGLAAEGLALLKKNPAIEVLDFAAIDRKDLKEKIPQVDILIVRSRTQVDRNLIEGARNLKLVLRAGIGLDNIDVTAATDLGIVVMNAPTGNIVTTAEHALAMLFAVSRHIPQADASMRTGKWDKKKYQGNEIRGKTLGLIGVGNIGKAVASRALGLGMKVLGYDPYLSQEAAARQNIGLVSLDELLKQADYVSIHVPLSEATRKMIDRASIAKMKPTAYLINCARGGIVDEAALIEALSQKKLMGAAMDVFETEPLPADHPFLKRDDVILTPHLGASTDEAQVQVSLEVAEQIAQYLESGVLKNAVNVPNVSLEQLKILSPYLVLCERLGSFTGQIIPQQNVKGVKVHYEGSITAFNREILTLSVLKGFLAPLLSTTVNFVNARKLLKERGIRVEESYAEECEDYTSLVKITVEGIEPLSCAGTLFGKGEPRIVSIDKFAIDAIPSGSLLYSRNTDQPGVIGAMGSILGQQGINIARMHLGRDVARKEAIALINLDSKVSEETLRVLRKTPGMLFVKSIFL